MENPPGVSSNQSVVERLPVIRSFHQWLIYGLQRSAPQRCPKYGRFPPHRMFHMDQVPLPFSATRNRTLNMVDEPCEMKEPGGSGSTKRMCSLQVCICADPNQGQPVALEIIFRGTGTRISPGLRRRHCTTRDQSQSVSSRRHGLTRSTCVGGSRGFESRRCTWAK